VSLNEDGYLLASCDDEGEFLLHEVPTGALLQRTFPDAGRTAVQFSTGENPFLFTGDALGRTAIWKVTR
jgi:hypothetical protein